MLKIRVIENKLARILDFRFIVDVVVTLFFRVVVDTNVGDSILDF